MVQSAQSQSLLATTASQTMNWSYWYETLVVQNNAVPGTGANIYVRTDGVAAVVDAAGTISVAPEETVILNNGAASGLPNANGTGSVAVYYCGAEKTNSQSEAVNWTVQNPEQGSGSVGQTKVTFIADTGTPGEVTVTAQ